MEHHPLLVVNGGIVKLLLKPIRATISLHKSKRIVDGNCFCYHKSTLYKTEYGMGSSVLYILEKRKRDLVIYCL